MLIFSRIQIFSPNKIIITDLLSSFFRLLFLPILTHKHLDTLFCNWQPHLDTLFCFNNPIFTNRIFYLGLKLGSTEVNALSMSKSLIINFAFEWKLYALIYDHLISYNLRLKLFWLSTHLTSLLICFLSRA